MDDLYDGEDVICKEPGDIREIDGYSGAICKCGRSLHIKTPKQKAWHVIKCPICGYHVHLYCGGKEDQIINLDKVN